MIKKKLCMLGATQVGKTSLVQRFVQTIFSDKYHPTVGVKIDKKQVVLGGRDVSLLLWDVQGEDETYTVRPSYLRGASGYLLVVDGARRGDVRDRVRAPGDGADAGRPRAVHPHPQQDGPLGQLGSGRCGGGARCPRRAGPSTRTSALTGQGVEGLPRARGADGDSRGWGRRTARRRGEQLRPERGFGCPPARDGSSTCACGARATNRPRRAGAPGRALGGAVRIVPAAARCRHQRSHVTVRDDQAVCAVLRQFRRAAGGAVATSGVSNAIASSTTFGVPSYSEDCQQVQRVMESRDVVVLSPAGRRCQAPADRSAPAARRAAARRRR